MASNNQHGEYDDHGDLGDSGAVQGEAALHQLWSVDAENSIITKMIKMMVTMMITMTIKMMVTMIIKIIDTKMVKKVFKTIMMTLKRIKQ